VRLFAFLILLASPISALAAPTQASLPIPEDLARKVVAHYAEIVHASYSDALSDAVSLDVAIRALVKKPSEASLASAREAWKRARVSYAHTEVFRFYGGPIDDPEKGPEGLINAWPLDEAYIDYVEGQSNAGLINRPQEFKKIDEALVVSLNEKNGEKNISTGYHAIEFLLWGQDLRLDTAGQRPASDYQKGKGANAERRARYLELLSKLLVKHLRSLRDEWTPATKGNYADKLKSESLDESLRKIYTGVIGLSIDEMAGERLTVPLEMNDQENEQSCFSDTTLRDAASNQEGIRSVYFGSYKNIQGPGLHELGLAVDAKLAASSMRSVETATARIAAIADKALDRILASKKKNDAERSAVNATISAFEAQARAVAATGLKMGLVLNIQ